jgi:hypothetical protein
VGRTGRWWRPPRFLTLPERSVFLFGPRGTGKTTWLRRTLPDLCLPVDRFLTALRPGRELEAG